MKLITDLKERLEKQVIKKIICNLNYDSNDDLIKLADIAKKLTPTNKDSIENIKELIRADHPATQLIRKILKEIDSNCRDKIVSCLVLQGLLSNQKKKEKTIKEGGYAPTTILISPTMRCNLKCIGCYAANYSKQDDLDIKIIDRIIQEAKDIGVSFFTILGGEPFIREDLFEIYAKHKDAYFQCYTNGTLINEKTIKKLLELGNVMPIISIEGYEAETDERRGKGTYKKIVWVMDELKKNKIPFGFSVNVTSKNADLISSDEFIDFLINKGAYLGWLFMYMPVGREPDLKLMPTPEQRKMLLGRVTHIRATKPIFIVDFWNDAPWVGGCIAGKEYIHINSKGDVEPCIFTHFAVDNIKNKSLKEVMNSPYFQELRKRQPYDENLFLPCMWIDHPQVSREIHQKFNVYPTHPGADEILTKENLRQGLDEYAQRVKEIYDPIWADYLKEHPELKSTNKPKQ